MCCLVQKERWSALQWRYNVCSLIRPFFITRGLFEPSRPKGAVDRRAIRPLVRPGGTRHPADARRVGFSSRVAHKGMHNRLRAVVHRGHTMPDTRENVEEVTRKRIRDLLSPFRRRDRVVLTGEHESRHVACNRGVFLGVRWRGAPHLTHREHALPAERLPLCQPRQLRIWRHRGGYLVDVGEGHFVAALDRDVHARREQLFQLRQEAAHDLTHKVRVPVSHLVDHARQYGNGVRGVEGLKEEVEQVVTVYNHILIEKARQWIGNRLPHWARIEPGYRIKENIPQMGICTIASSISRTTTEEDVHGSPGIWFDSRVEVHL